MNENETISTHPLHVPIHILLADDDSDDHLFFDKVLSELAIPTRLTILDDGEKLMTYLFKNTGQLPDVLFLDINMPRKNGSECLSEIKLNDKLKHLPVIIYSTSLHEEAANLLYNKGAYFYVRKTDLSDLQKVLHYILTLLQENRFTRPTGDKFILSLAAV